jgi:hypothetical protein
MLSVTSPSQKGCVMRGTDDGRELAEGNGLNLSPLCHLRK